MSPETEDRPGIPRLPSLPCWLGLLLCRLAEPSVTATVYTFPSGRLGPGGLWCGVAYRPVLSGLVRGKPAILSPWAKGSPEQSTRGHIDLQMVFSARGEVITFKERSCQLHSAGLVSTKTLRLWL